MRKIIILNLFSLLFASIVYAEDIGIDKYYHVGASSMIGFTSGLVMSNMVVKDLPFWQRLTINTSVALIPGTVKELHDDKFDWQDMGANLIGALVGVLSAEALTQWVIIPSERGVIVGYKGGL